MTFRNLETASSASLPSEDDSFVFDGTNSDIARQLFIRYRAGNSEDQFKLNAIPSVVTGRLEPLNIVFDDLPGLVQRVILWDSGFAISPGNDAVQIWTIGNYTMADIAVPKNDVESADCTFKNCPQPNDKTAHYTLICSGDQMLSVSRCVADTFTDNGAVGFLGAMWSRGGAPDMVPQIRLRGHVWKDPVSNASFSVYAVHTTSSVRDVTWNECPVNDGYGSLAIPSGPPIMAWP